MRVSFRSRKRASSTTARSISASAFSNEAIALSIKWCQAARSGKQNIQEGSDASGTSKETEIKLTGIAKASLGELLEDYRDFLRTRGIEEWTKDHPYTRRLRQLNRQPNATCETFKKGIEHPDPAIAANVMIGLIKATRYLIDRQLLKLEKAFIEEGGLRERMTRARLAHRAKST
jgi:four helix bundle suffix protein